MTKLVDEGVINPLNEFEHRIIANPEGEPYLVRFNLLSAFGWSLRLHVFVRGDEDRCLHDHPWNFWSLILLGGYYEETEGGVQKWYRPGRLLYRPAEWKHRVILREDGQPCATLVLMARRRRNWGFWTKRGWVLWKDFLGNHDEQEC